MKISKKSRVVSTAVALTSPVAGGIVVSSASATKLSSAVSDLLKQAGIQVNSRWVSVAVAGTVGFGVGYGSVAALWWLRWQLIVLLLKYNGWLFNHTSLKTKLWGLTLKTLVGPGPHRTYDLGDAMPSLPVPPLDSSCDRYLKTVKPLLTPDEYRETEQAVEDLRRNDGPVLQQYLLKRFREKRSWLADWWLDTAYLTNRQSIALNVNFFMTSTVVPEVSKNRIARAVNSAFSILTGWEALKKNGLEPQMVLGFLPLCMDGSKYMFGTVRLPGEQIDKLRQYPNSKHIIVIRNGVYYKVVAYTTDKRGRERLLTKREFKQQFEYIMDHAEEGGYHELPVASLTSQDRSTWAKHRALLRRNIINATAVEEIESAIYITILNDTKEIQDPTDQAMRAMAGDGYSRWFDKSCSIELFTNSGAAGLLMEHAGADASHFIRFWELCLTEECYGPDGDIIGDPTPKDAPKIKPPEKLEWQFDNKTKDLIMTSYQNYMEKVEALDLVILHTDVDKRWMKSKRVSPDGLVQMAMQLAFWRMHKVVTKTYEPATTRLFALGRTDNINPVSEASVKWTQTFDDLEVSAEEKIKLMKEAIRLQKVSQLDCTAGLGCDRHFLGLLLAARELGRDVPSIFRDKSWSLPMRLSTSQTPNQVAHVGVPLVMDSINGGFGPACEDGYGILYAFLSNERMTFSITSWKTCPETDSVKFADSIVKAMKDVRTLLDSV